MDENQVTQAQEQQTEAPRRLLDDADQVEKHFGPGAQNIYGTAVRTVAKQAMQDDLLTREEADARASAWESHYRALGLTAIEAEQIAKVKPPTDDQRAQWREWAREDLNKEYGERAGQILRDTKAYLAKHPALRDHLHKTGLGDSPAWVRTLAAKAIEARKQGKL